MQKAKSLYLIKLSMTKSLTYVRYYWIQFKPNNSPMIVVYQGPLLLEFNSKYKFEGSADLTLEQS